MPTNARAFSLTELLVVIAMIAVMSGLLIPAIRDFDQSRKVEAAATRLSAEMALARATAISQNTYTWVAIGEGDAKGLRVAVFRSNDGTSVADDSDLSLVSRVAELSGVRLTGSGSIHPDLNRATGGILLDQPVGGRSLPPTGGLDRARTITFTPQGQSLLESDPDSGEPVIPLIELVLSPAEGDPVSPRQALVELRGATGKSRVVRIQ